jgi:hypothetical protein
LTRQAATRTDVAAAILGARKVPCICPPRQTEDGRPLPSPGSARSLGVLTSRGIPTEQMECETCGKTWKRVHAGGRVE